MPRCRPFTLGDAMILIAATAVGLGVLPMFSGAGSPRAATPFFQALFLTVPSLLAVTFSLLVLRLRRPRPSLPRLMRQPGLFACVAVALLVATEPPVLLVVAAKEYPRVRGISEEVIEAFVELYPPIVGFVVLIAWGLLLISGRWRRERGWIDGAGILLGSYWVFLSVAWLYHIV